MSTGSIVLLIVAIVAVITLIAVLVVYLYRKYKKAPNETFVIVKDDEVSSLGSGYNIGMNFAKIYLSSLIGAHENIGATPDSSISLSNSLGKK